MPETRIYSENVGDAGVIYDIASPRQVYQWDKALWEGPRGRTTPVDMSQAVDLKEARWYYNSILGALPFRSDEVAYIFVPWHQLLDGLSFGFVKIPRMHAEGMPEGAPPWTHRKWSTGAESKDPEPSFFDILLDD